MIMNILTKDGKMEVSRKFFKSFGVDVVFLIFLRTALTSCQGQSRLISSMSDK